MHALEAHARTLASGLEPARARAGRDGGCSVHGVKIGIVVPFSWSFWGAVVEHAELQAAALEDLGHEVRLIMGNDPPGQFTRALHPRIGRHDSPPPNVLPVGRSVIVPANGSLPNIVLSPRAYFRIRRALERERFDVLHLHEPMTPAICTAVLLLARTPLVATFHASGDLGWMRLGTPLWGFLVDRVDHRIAVSERARVSQQRWLPGEYEVIPNGVLIPDAAPAGGREHRIVFVGRHEPRKGLEVLLRAWPELRRRTGLSLTIAGADPLAVRLLLTRLRVPDEGLDVVGFLSQEELTRTLLEAKALVAPSLGQESFGMVLTRAFACTLPVVASDIPGYREVLDESSSLAVPPGDPAALADAVASLVADEPRRQALGESARALARERYSWASIAGRLDEIYADVSGRSERRARAA
jgi:phosphatidylinositol alpha-mannosyltransferase